MTASGRATRQASVVVRRCAELAGISSEPGRTTRVHLSPEHLRVNDVVGGWMREAGLAVHVDAVGNLHGRLAPTAAGPEDAPVRTLLLGSHLDTVVDAGRYDGVVGVLMALATVERLVADGTALPFALEVVAFTDEEGTRFGTALLGSSAVAGHWDDAWWDLVDADGTTLREASVAAGLDPALVGTAALDPTTLVGYLEAHIEQAPHLDEAGRALGVVTGIAGARRFVVDVTGEARHAGGTPFARRRDALLAAAEAALAVERTCRERDQIGTVGTLTVAPGAVNVVPGRARFSVDLRGETDAGRDAAWDAVTAELDAIAARRGVTVAVRQVHEAGAVRCADRMREAVRAGVLATGDATPAALFSRAGHDAMALAAVTDVGMLFLRNPDGTSHHPDEHVAEADVALGLDALAAAVVHLASEDGGSGR